MEINIKEEKENKLLQRKEVVGGIVFTGATPSNEALKKELATKYKVSEGTIVIKNIYTKYGVQKAEFLAFIYSSKEQLEKIEPKPKKKEEKPGAKPAEEKPEEKIQ